jgi:hypothetical protein
MSKQSSISDIINSKGYNAKRVKNYATVHETYVLYWKAYYDTMNKNIRRYGSFRFFKDLAVYLNDNHKNGLFKSFIFRDISEIYINNL